MPSKAMAAGYSARHTRHLMREGNGIKSQGFGVELPPLYDISDL